MGRGVKNMRRIDKYINGERYILETFDSFGEILKVCDSREVKPTVYDVTRRQRNESFYGAKSYEEAVKMLKFGESKDIEKVNKAVKDLAKSQTALKTSFKNDIVGYAPNVPNAIMGVPQSMINSTRIPKKSKVITIMVDMAVSGGVRKDSVFEYGLKVVQKIMQLEHSGYRVRLEYLKAFNHDGQHAGVSTVIKNENQPLDLKRIVFPLTNVAMQRYISWDWYDRVPDAKWDCGRGRSLSTFGYTEKKRIIDGFIKDASDKYIIVYGDDLDAVFSKLK